jgi:phosphatidylglycerophosphate synthase
MYSEVTVGDIRDSFPDGKSDALWTRFVLRPLSFPLAWLFIKLGFSANQVTYFSIICTLSGTGLFLSGSESLAVAAAVLFNVFALLDCVDGNIARARPGENPYGQWIDALGGYISYTAVFISMGVFVEIQAGLLELDWVDFVFVGAVAATTNLLIRVQHQKYDNIRPQAPDNAEDEQSNSIKKSMSRNAGITGFLMPLVFLGTVFSALDIVLIGYAVFYTSSWITTTLGRIYQIQRS